ncbi:MAG: hypothetical protein AABZ55_09220, partial [Bdellovibrionota bacterium]
FGFNLISFSYTAFLKHSICQWVKRDTFFVEISHWSRDLVLAYEKEEKLHLSKVSHNCISMGLFNCLGT